MIGIMTMRMKENIMKHKTQKVLIAGALILSAVSTHAADNRTNFLVITADDMNYNSVGCFGAEMKGLTPNLDKLASEGIRFEHAHVASTVCMPSRNAINSGRLPHRSGGEGFHHFRFPDVPTIPHLLTKNGYRVGILGKVAHSTPYENTPWDFAEEIGRNTEVFYEKTAAFIDASKKEGKPFYFIVNSHDPHRPYYNIKDEGNELRKGKDGIASSHPTRVVKLEEVIIPSFIPDTPETRHELACYYSSVVRCDDVVGKMMDLLKDKGIADNTLVIFLSDHGMGMPSAKANCYLNSTKTPMIARWTGHIKPGMVDEDDFVSSMDIFPTVLDIAGIKSPGGFDGVSLVPAFKGEKLKDREKFGTQFYATIGKAVYNMQKYQDKKFAYMFNPFCSGKRTYNSSSLGGSCFKAMLKLPEYKERCEFLLRRVPEEFYDIEKDPNCLKNLIDNPEYAGKIDEFKKMMRENMVRTKDPMIPVFDVYQESKSIDKMHEQFVKTLAECGQLGRDPGEVKLEKWTDPNYKKNRKKKPVNKKTSDTKSKGTDDEKAAARRAKREARKKAEAEKK